MCGITGIVALNGRPVDLRVLQRMNDVQAHRGPDGEGFIVSWPESNGFCSAFLRHTTQERATPPARVALGHRRLAILDLSDRGLQPMSAGASGAWIVFNGEIYNHQELRSELEAGAATSTPAPTPRCCSRATWSGARNASSDWMACSPLPSGMGPGAGSSALETAWASSRSTTPLPQDHFIFASEIKGLLPFPGLPCGGGRRSGARIPGARQLRLPRAHHLPGCQGAAGGARADPRCDQPHVQAAGATGPRAPNLLPPS